MIARTIPLLLGGLLLTACATTTEKPRPTSRIDVQEEVGFTITEASPVPAGSGWTTARPSPSWKAAIMPVGSHY